MDTSQSQQLYLALMHWGRPVQILSVISKRVTSMNRWFECIPGSSSYVGPCSSRYCIFVLRGHTSTIRCIKVLHNRPTAVTGSRDSTLRVWDVQRGRMLRVLQGHQQSVRCLDVCGNKVVSGSYDTTLRVSLQP